MWLAKDSREMDPFLTLQTSTKKFRVEAGKHLV
jgi:hypothetical protein